MKLIWKSLLLLLLFPVCAHSQTGLIAPVGQWTAYQGYNCVVEITNMQHLIVMATKGGVVIRDPATDFILTLSTPDGLHNSEPTSIFADQDSWNIFVGYKDGMMDVIDKDFNITRISDINRTDQYTTKTINRIISDGTYLYIATSFGVVVFDIDRMEVKTSIVKIGTNVSGAAVTGVALADNRLWAAMSSLGLWSVDLAEANINRPEVWVQESTVSNLSGLIKHICSMEDTVYALHGDTIKMKKPGSSWVHSTFPYESWVYLNSANGYVFGSYDDFAMRMDAVGNFNMTQLWGKIQCAYSHGGMLLLGERFTGCFRFDEWGLESLTPSGPRINTAVDLAAGNGELYIAHMGKKGSSARQYNKDGIPYFNFHGDGWKIIDHRTGELSTDSVYQDFFRLYYDDQEGICYAGSWGEGIVEMKNGEVLRTITATNSDLPQKFGNSLIGGMQKDEFGNLWIALAVTDYPLVMVTPEGNWYKYTPYAGIEATGLVIDDYNNKWIIDQGNGIVIFNENYTYDDPSDDQARKLTTSYLGGGLNSNSVYSLAVDKDEQVWIGTSEGVSIMYDPSVLWTQDFQDAACPIIEGYCLLRDQRVNSIVVDGGNRKWLGTESGVYMVNYDGTEMMAHYTTSNSPLPSNIVNAVEIDKTTGEVFFGTDRGVVSYMGDAIEGHEDASELYAFPNPVSMDYEGTIMIKGMKSNSTVKIVTVSGKVVRELESNGGEITWNGFDTYGNKITPGVYLVLVSDADGQGAGITKLAVIERK